MTVGLAPAQANAILTALKGGTAYSGSGTLYVQLHVGDPGAAGTANAAAETTRKAMTFGTPSGGQMANTNAETWTAVAATEHHTHFSIWTASSGGTFIISGIATLNAVGIGDDLAVAIGQLVVSLGVAA